jgi:hypothetical protein
MVGLAFALFSDEISLPPTTKAAIRVEKSGRTPYRRLRLSSNTDLRREDRPREALGITE